MFLLQVHERKSLASLVVLNSMQNLIITVGLLAGCLLCAKEVSEGARTVHIFIYLFIYLFAMSVYLLGGRLCSFYYVRPSALSTAQLVWNLL